MRNLPWRAAQAFALVVLVFWAGAFALFVFPGHGSERQEIARPEPTAYIAPCDRIREGLMAKGFEHGVDSWELFKLRALGCAAYPPTD
jgi:hypothetical protein